MEQPIKIAIRIIEDNSTQQRENSGIIVQIAEKPFK